MKDPLEKDSLPFPKHWVGYVAIKIVVLALAVLLAVHLAGMI